MSDSVIDIVEKYNKLALQEKELYISLIQQANEDCKEIMKDDLGSQFVHSCARDLAGEVVRQFFDTSDFYITVDQLADRMIHFSYDNDVDPLSKDVKKNVYNYSEKNSSTLKNIISDIDSHQQKLFEKNKDPETGKNTDYKDKKIIEYGKRRYRESQTDADGKIHDELTGNEGGTIEDKNGNKRSNLEVDHQQAAAAAKFNNKYITKKGVEDLKFFFNSKDNFAMIDKTANQSKGDVRVYDKNGNDITHRATPEQLADAVCERWENVKNPETKQKLIDKGYLNEDGTVNKSVKKKLTENLRHSQNVESKVILKNVKYDQVAKDAAKNTAANLYKIVAGQVIYYAAPPLLYEVKTIVREKDITIDNALVKIEKAGKRVGNYVYAHLKDILGNVAVNSIKSFVKTFMDILINLVKATVKKMLQMAKSLCLAVVDSVKIIADKNRTPAEKGDAIFSLLGVTVANIAIEALFEYIEAQTGIPEFLLTPLQIITSVVCSNLVIIVLQKLDLFDVRLGFKMNKIQEIFDNARTQFVEESKYLLEQTSIDSKLILQDINNETKAMFTHLSEVSAFDYSVREDLQRISDIFAMNVDFEKSWNNYLGL